MTKSIDADGICKQCRLPVYTDNTDNNYYSNDQLCGCDPQQEEEETEEFTRLERRNWYRYNPNGICPF